MKHFTEKNTEGYTGAELEELNKRANRLLQGFNLESDDDIELSKIDNILDDLLTRYDSEPVALTWRVLCSRGQVDPDDSRDYHDLQEFIQVDFEAIYGEDWDEEELANNYVEASEVFADYSESGLIAECPHCGIFDGYTSNEAPNHGTTSVRCSECDRVFNIRWWDSK